MRALMEAEEATVDLERQIVAFDGREVPFEINPEVRERLLQGLDEIALTLEHEDEIERFERENAEPRVPHHAPCRIGLHGAIPTRPTRASSGRRASHRAGPSPASAEVYVPPDPALVEELRRVRFWSTSAPRRLWSPRSWP